MYEKFYGLSRRPFSILPQAEFLYLTAQHRTALSLLEYGILKPSLFSLITGDIGTGKSTLIRHLLARLGSSISVGLISNTHKGFGELLEWTLQAFGLDFRNKDKVEMFQLLSNFLTHEHVKNRRVILVVDEAQNMTVDALEELRMVSNVNADRHHLLQIILIGQSKLREKLRLPALQQFAQRIETDFHLRPLSVQDTEAYIRHRIRVASARDGVEIFSPDSAALIHQISHGVPRVINLICDTALVYGFASGKNQIDLAVVEELNRDKLAQGGWLFDPVPEPSGMGNDLELLSKKVAA
jgi:type II secretory pathway predicted ATPase ExeA